MQISKMKTLCIAMAFATPAFAQDATTEDPAMVEEVLVTGFRQSLEAALDNKRDAVNTKESIVAEDIGKMADLNLAEAIQRVPGVAIVREGGEGRQISLRGLGSEFTHVTLNGMEVPSSAGGLDSSGGVNRGRSFDFNVFSAELFNRIDVNKSPTASIEEGGIAGSVELFTLRPLDVDPTLVANAQLGYNDLSEEIDPRLTVIYSDTNEAETFGWMVSAAYTQRTAYQDGFGTVRWDNPTDDSSAFAANNTEYSDEVVNGLWYPRLPRQDSFHHNQDRIGLSGALQFRPTDTLEFGVNYVSSSFDSDVESYNSFAQFRRNGGWGWPANTVEDVTIATDGGTDYAIAGSFTGVGLRTESRRQKDTTDFSQLTGDVKWDINDSLTLTGMIGSAESKFKENYFRANIENNNDGVDFSYDFTRDPDVAVIQYENFDVTDASNFYLMNNERIRDYIVDRTNNTQRVDLDWQLNDSSSFKFGVMMNQREVSSEEYRNDNELDTSTVSVADIGKVYTYDDTGGFGSDTELRFVVLDYDAAAAAFGGSYILTRGPGVQTWKVEEDTTALYGEYNLDTEIAGHGFRLNAGIRSIQTDVTATGYLDQTTSNKETNDFSNALPSLNIAFDATDDMILRLGIAKTLTRPSMSSLAPSKSISDVNQTVSGGNSQLEPLISDDINLSWEWYFADEAIVAINLFRKEIDSFISSPTVNQALQPEDVAIVQSLYPTQVPPDLDPGLLDPTLEWRYSSPQNTEGTTLDGWEIAYQQTFTSLPGIWSNFGVLANYSWVDADTVITRAGVEETAPLEGLSENSYNATLYYEVDDWGARISVNSRDDYVTNNIGSNHNYSEATTGPTHVDFSSFYNINDNLTLTFEVVNLTDEYERLYTTGTDGNMNLVREYNHTGRQLFLGVRASF